MRRVALLALSLIVVGVWSQDRARGQSSTAPPVSLAAPNAPPHASAKNAKPAASGKEPSPAVTGGLAALPSPAADYDGFNAGTDENDAPSRLTPPARPRAARDTGLDAQTLVDQEDEALKRKLTICKNCK